MCVSLQVLVPNLEAKNWRSIRAIQISSVRVINEPFWSPKPRKPNCYIPFFCCCIVVVVVFFCNIILNPVKSDQFNKRQHSAKQKIRNVASYQVRDQFKTLSRTRSPSQMQHNKRYIRLFILSLYSSNFCLYIFYFKK